MNEDHRQLVRDSKIGIRRMGCQLLVAEREKVDPHLGKRGHQGKVRVPALTKHLGDTLLLEATRNKFCPRHLWILRRALVSPMSLTLRSQRGSVMLRGSVTFDSARSYCGLHSPRRSGAASPAFRTSQRQIGLSCHCFLSSSEEGANTAMTSQLWDGGARAHVDRGRPSPSASTGCDL